MVTLLLLIKRVYFFFTHPVELPKFEVKKGDFANNFQKLGGRLKAPCSAFCEMEDLYQRGEGGGTCPDVGYSMCPGRIISRPIIQAKFLIEKTPKTCKK